MTAVLFPQVSVTLLSVCWTCLFWVHLVARNLTMGCPGGRRDWSCKGVPSTQSTDCSEAASTQ